MKLGLYLKLRDAGVLHKRLLARIRLLGIIAVILLLISIRNIIEYDLSVWISLALVIGSFLLGLFVFSKMYKIAWDDEQEILSTASMDTAGVVILLLYIAFEIGLRTLVKSEFADTSGATTFVFIAIGGSLLGRTLGTVMAVLKLAGSEGVLNRTESVEN